MIVVMRNDPTQRVTISLRSRPDLAPISRDEPLCGVMSLATTHLAAISSHLPPSRPLPPPPAAVCNQAHEHILGRLVEGLASEGLLVYHLTSREGWQVRSPPHLPMSRHMSAPHLASSPPPLPSREGRWALTWDRSTQTAPRRVRSRAISLHLASSQRHLHPCDLASISPRSRLTSYLASTMISPHLRPTQARGAYMGVARVREGQPLRRIDIKVYPERQEARDLARVSPASRPCLSRISPRSPVPA